MNQTDVTYGQLDRVLRSRGFACRLLTDEPAARVYNHAGTGAFITVPAYPDDERVYEHHLVTVRATLDGFGIADPTTFAADLKKAG